MVSLGVRRREREARVTDRFSLQRKINDGRVLFATAERPHMQRRFVGLRQDDPFPTASGNEASWMESWLRAHARSFNSPNRSLCAAKTCFQVLSSSAKRATTKPASARRLSTPPPALPS